MGKIRKNLWNEAFVKSRGHKLCFLDTRNKPKNCKYRS